MILAFGWLFVVLGALGILEMLDRLEGTNGFAMWELVVSHADITVTRDLEIDVVDGVGVVVVAMVVLGW